MIKQFSKRILFPKNTWNSLVRWIGGISSPSGTIEIRNTMDPGEGASCTFDVDTDAVYSALIQRLRNEFVPRDEMKYEQNKFDENGGQGGDTETYGVKPTFSGGALTSLRFGTKAQLDANTGTVVNVVIGCPYGQSGD